MNDFDGKGKENKNNRAMMKARKTGIPNSLIALHAFRIPLCGLYRKMTAVQDNKRIQKDKSQYFSAANKV